MEGRFPMLSPRRLNSRDSAGSSPKSPRSQVTRLDLVLNDPEVREDLVVALIEAQKSEVSTKIRFLLAMKDLDREKSKKEKTTKANKIVEVFLSRSSRFQLTGLPANLDADLATSKFVTLDSLKRTIHVELLHEPTVMTFVQERYARMSTEEELKEW